MGILHTTLPWKAAIFSGSLFYTLKQELDMADLMWGGVPFTIPSVTAMKYSSGAVQVKREKNLPIGGHYNARQTMERELVGHKMSRRDMVDSYEYYDRLTRQHRSEPRQQWSQAEQSRPARLTAGRLLTLNKPGGGLGWSQPRMESVIGCVDRRKFLPGYIGGVKIRDSVFAH